MEERVFSKEVEREAEVGEEGFTVGGAEGVRASEGFGAGGEGWGAAVA